jgi:uncharacterized membrane protein YhaH (DUF805 family)
MLNNSRKPVQWYSDGERRVGRREFFTYGILMILVAFAIAFLFTLSLRGAWQAHYDITAALFLLFGIPLLGGGILFLVFALPFICFDSCPDDIAPVILRYLLVALILGANCAGAGWTVGLISLARRRLWLWFSLALLSLPAVILINLLVLSQSIGGQLLPHTEDELYQWLTTLAYVVLPVALCWPVATIIALGLARQPAVRVLAS